MAKPILVDVYNMSENDRIKFIGNYAMIHGEATFYVDADTVPEGVGKADRYLIKLTKLYPRLVEKKRTDGPVKDTVTITVRRLDD